MKPFQASLADQLDQWCDAGAAHIVETDDVVVVADLDSLRAQALVSLLTVGGWPVSIYDSTEEEVGTGGIQPDFGPFVVRFEKPKFEQARVVTRAGLSTWLEGESPAGVLQVAQISAPIETYTMALAPWGDRYDYEPMPMAANPRHFVKEVGNSRLVVQDLGPWVLREGARSGYGDPAIKQWRDRSASVLVHSVADEVESDGSFLFRGPPTLKFRRPERLTERMTEDDFCALHEMARWTYASEAEAETRRSYIAAEIGRTAFSEDDDPAALAKIAARRALECARIAHQVGVQKISLDTMKALADLRKAVSDETARLSESARQLAGSVTGALFTGIAVMAARLSMNLASRAFDFAVVGIAVVLLLYVAALVVSGWVFLDLQRRLRSDWRQRLYRYLPEAEYRQLVTAPAQSAERAYRTAAWMAVTIMILLALLMTAIAFPEEPLKAVKWVAGLTGTGFAPAPAAPGGH